NSRKSFNRTVWSGTQSSSGVTSTIGSCSRVCAISRTYNNILDFNNGLTQFQQNGRWGSLDKYGNVVIPPHFISSYYFSEGRAVVGYIFNEGYIDKKGNYITDSNFFDAKAFKDGLAIVITADSARYGMIDTSGKVVTPCKYGYINGFSEGLCAVNIGGVFSSDLYQVLGGSWGFMNKSGNLAIPAEYEGAGFFSEGLCAVKKKGKWGFINKDNMVVIPFQFQTVFEFSSGMARIIKSGKYGYIDKTGKIKIAPQYDYALDFHNGFAIVNKGSVTKEYEPDYGKPGKCGVINTSGRYIVPLEFDGIRHIGKNIFKVIKGKGWGYYNSKGQCIFVVTE
ncbi:MAG: WG repeat-containing protein, partial [Bacteroidales bacterium]|nr:WG repeat-containing protein [Bacteroidales bacterium]